MVYGNANVKPFANKYPLAGLDAADQSRWRLGMLHASFEIPDVVDDTYVVTPAQIAASGLDYIALGHYHSLSDKSAGDVTAFYPGSPDMVRVQKGDFGNVLLVEIDETTVKVQPVRIGKRSYEELTIKAEDAGAAGLAAMIESRADMEKVLHIVIEGARRPGYPDMEEVVAPLADSFFHISLTDRSWAAPSTLEPVAYPEGSPARIYLQALQDMIGGASESEKDEITDAMQIGLAMLLGGDAPCD